MKANEMIIKNECGLTAYEVTYLINKLFERNLINVEEKIQEFRVNKNRYIIVEHTKEYEFTFTLTTNSKINKTKAA